MFTADHWHRLFGAQPAAQAQADVVQRVSEVLLMLTCSTRLAEDASSEASSPT